MSVLVRIVHHPPFGGGIHRDADADISAHERGNTHHGVPQMGDNDLVHDSSDTKCHLARPDVHLPTQAVEPRSEGETGE